jgi:tripartite-type tricarboxylate transporter receptor subunit TctC
MHTRRQLLGALAAAPLLGNRLARAQTQAFAGRTVTLIVPYPAGNPTDAIARKLQPLLGQVLKQTVIVENVPGAGGSLGTAKVLGAPADGNTVLVSTPSELILSPLSIQNVRYKPEDFRMVGMFGRSPYVLVSRADLPYANVSELIASRNASHARPMSYGSIGQGSLIHLISAQFGRQTGLDLLHVPYKGVPPMMQDILGGQLDLGFLPANGPTVAFIEQGKLRGYGITAAQPSGLFPKLPPLPGQHPSLANFSFETWGAFHVPRNTPDAVAQRWNQVFYEVTRDEDFRAWARSTGTDLLPPMSNRALDDQYRAEALRYQELARAIGVKAEG